LAWPADGPVLRGFGRGPAGESRGIDIAVEPGTPVRAAGRGTVTYAGTPASAYGPLVILEHEGGLFTVYGNLRDYRVERGARVEAGETLGTSGARDPTLPPHLHFEVRRGQEPADPLLFLPPR
jgi:murein DD-endopeptidase MepM/ murein hydrolase activator NlpD